MNDLGALNSNTHAQTLEIVPETMIPAHLTGEIQSKLAYVDPSIHRAQVTEELVSITLKQALPADRLAEIEKKVLSVLDKMVKGSIRPKIQILEDHLDRPVPYRLNPMEELLRSGDVHREDTGIYSQGPKVTRLIEYFESRFLNLADSFGAQPYRFPTLIPAAYLERVNYFRAFPHSLTFATHLVEDLEVIDEFSRTACCDETGDLNAPPEFFSQVRALLSPAVCYHLYFALADSFLENGSLCATAVGNCFRYEAINLESLERMWNFNMREVIFVGSKEFVLDNRETARKRMADFFAQIGLSYRVESANDPFFIGEFRKQAAFQSAFQLKFEIRASLPYKTSHRTENDQPGKPQSPSTVSTPGDCVDARDRVDAGDSGNRFLQLSPGFFWKGIEHFAARWLPCPYRLRGIRA